MLDVGDKVKTTSLYQGVPYAGVVVGLDPNLITGLLRVCTDATQADCREFTADQLELVTETPEA